MKKIIIALILISISTLVGCITPEIESKPTCISPYIEYKIGECCLDANSNNICDDDEEPIQQEQIQEVEKELFSIGDSYHNPGSTLEKIGTESYITFSSTAPQGTGTSGSITFPLTFNNEARDVDFQMRCYDEVNEDILEAVIDDEEKYMNAFNVLGEDDEYISFFTYFGDYSAKSFILTNNEAFGSKIEYTGKGIVRVLLYPTSSIKEGGSRSYECTLTVTSHDPPEKQKKDFKLKFT